MQLGPNAPAKSHRRRLNLALTARAAPSRSGAAPTRARTPRPLPIARLRAARPFLGGDASMPILLSDVVLVSCVAAWIAGIVISIASLLS